MLEAVVDEPVRGSYSAAAVQGGRLSGSAPDHGDRLAARSHPTAVPDGRCTRLAQRPSRFRWPGRRSRRRTRNCRPASRAGCRPVAGWSNHTHRCSLGKADEGRNACSRWRSRTPFRDRTVRPTPTGVATVVPTYREHPAVGQQDGRVAVALLRSSLPVAVQVPLAGSYTSEPLSLLTSTLPSRSSIGRATPQAQTIFPVARSTSRAGSYSSRRRDLSVTGRRPGPCRRAAGRPQDATPGLSMLPVADQVPVTGSYSSAEVILLPAAAAHHEHPAIEEPHRGVARARRAHRPGRDPDASRPRDRDRTRGWCRRFARARGRRIGRCRGDRDHRWFRHRRDDGRQPQEAGARRQRPADEQQGCGREKRHAATPAEPSGNAPWPPGGDPERRP